MYSVGCQLLLRASSANISDLYSHTKLYAIQSPLRCNNEHGILNLGIKKYTHIYHNTDLFERAMPQRCKQSTRVIKLYAQCKVLRAQSVNYMLTNLINMAYYKCTCTWTPQEFNLWNHTILKKHLLTMFWQEPGR